MRFFKWPLTFRVFIEVSLDAYIHKHQSEFTNITQNSSLKNKLQTVAGHLENHGYITAEEKQPINTAISSPDQILSTRTLNAYVHNRHVQPKPVDLKIAWDNLESFLKCVWSKFEAE